MDIFESVVSFAQGNHYVDVEDKIPIFICSIGAHLFNTSNKCSRCDFDPEDGDAPFTLDFCPFMPAFYSLSLSPTVPNFGTWPDLMRCNRPKHELVS